jgi:glycosyltransferase involved in cell wall biosynthesis
MKKPLLFVIFRLPAPYFEPLFESIQKSGSIDLIHFYEMRGREGTAWGLEENIFVNSRNNIRRFFGYNTYKSGIVQVINSLKAFYKTIKYLEYFKPEFLLIHGYSYPSTWAGILWAIVKRKRFGFRSDSNFFNDTSSGLKKQFKTYTLKALVKASQTIFYIGSANKKYWEKYGANSESLVEAKYAVDNLIFKPLNTSVNYKENSCINFLFTGRLINRKNIIPLVKGFKKSFSNYADIKLTIVGDGPEKSQLFNFLDENPGLPINYLGKVHPNLIANIYQEHDVFICPYEKEPWGLAVNEAMSCGLALCAPKDGTFGAAYDLMFPGKNGIEIETISSNGISDAINEFVRKKGNLSIYKANSLDIIKDWTYDSAKTAFINATLNRGH